jgi:hypothetical protein
MAMAMGALKHDKKHDNNVRNSLLYSRFSVSSAFIFQPLQSFSYDDLHRRASCVQN